MPSIPGIGHRRAIRAFEKVGFCIVRQGKHVSMVKGDRIIIIPRHDPINPYTMASSRTPE